jgi:parvulin-like peptidyl-prolyl isomerase
MLLNVGFGITILVAVLLLLVAAGAAWYGDHLAGIATVNGTSISKDALKKQEAVNAFLADYQQRRIRTLLAAGHIRSADADARISAIQTALQQNATSSLEQLVDGSIQADLATKQGVTVTDADIAARMAVVATTPELRHAWMIEVKPDLATGSSTPTDAAKAAAKAKADQALADLKAGKDWETIAKGVSTDAASKAQAGDISYIDANASLDADFLAALMAASKDAPTDVIAGADGTYRIGRVTDIIAPVVDATLASQVSDAGISTGDFNAALRRDATHTKLSDAIVAQYLAPGPQRQVSEIYMQNSASETGPSAIRVRHILYSPNGDPTNASKVAATDPAWAAAKAKADATYAKLKADPTQFDAIARAESDEGSAKTSGGKLPYFSTDDQIDPSFAAAIFKGGYQPGQLLEPIKSTFGWHVIQVMHYPTDAAWATNLKTQIDAGTLKFADAARDNSDKANAANGGDMGWVGKGQLDPAIEAAIMAAPVGKVSDPLSIPNDGIYLFQVAKEETRTPDAAQKAALETSAFPIWYSRQKAGYTITRDPSVTSATGA